MAVLAGIAAVEQALISRLNSLGKIVRPFLLRSDNGLVVTDRHYAHLVPQLQPEAGIHRLASPPAERNVRAGHPNDRRIRRALESAQIPIARDTKHRKRDRLRQ